MTSRLFVWFLIAFRLHSKIPIVRDRLSEDHQRCEIVRAFFGICDSSTGHPNIQCSGLIMSQFKVEKGRISRYKALVFFIQLQNYSPLRDRDAFYFGFRPYGEISPAHCLVTLFNSYQSERAYRSFGQS